MLNLSSTFLSRPCTPPPPTAAPQGCSLLSVLFSLVCVQFVFFFPLLYLHPVYSLHSSLSNFIFIPIPSSCSYLFISFFLILFSYNLSSSLETLFVMFNMCVMASPSGSSCPRGPKLTSTALHLKQLFIDSSDPQARIDFPP